MIIEPSIWIWVPLALATLAGLLGQPKTSYGLLAAAIFGALLEERLSLQALATVLIGLGVAFFAPRQDSVWKKAIAYGFVLIWSLAMFAHLLPGFANLKVLHSVVSGPQSVPFNMHLNLDKPLVFFALLLAYPVLLGQAKTVNLKVLLASSALLIVLLPIATGTGAIRPELTLPDWWWLFALNNLLFTCVAEEALFRGFIQQSLTRRFGWVAGVVVASLLFGLAHFAGGITLVLFATLAGLGYGLMFHFTGRLSVAVTAHFLFNFAHLIFFTYPVAIR